MKNINQIQKYSLEDENTDGYYNQLEFQDTNSKKNKIKKKKKRKIFLK